MRSSLVLAALALPWLTALAAQAQQAPPAPTTNAPPAVPQAAAARPTAESAAPSRATPAGPTARRYEGQVNPSAPLAYEYAAPEEGSSEAAGGPDIPSFSVRMDPLNWLLEGRLGLELEVQVWEPISVELVPIFVVNEDPPLIDWGPLEDIVTQHSNGLGPLAGASLGVGFWLDGEPFRGTVLRAILTNYGYAFEAADASGVFDRVERTERRFVGFIGSYSRWGLFTIGGGLGLGYELNSQERCNVAGTGGESGCDELRIALDDDAGSYADLNGFLHPVYLEGRLSLGLAFE